MNPNITLLVMAAGLGSRYGGSKQTDGIGPSGERLMDYTIFDAIRVGFNKIVFVIHEEMQPAFEEQVLKKISKTVAVDYVCQQLDALPEGFSVPKGRQKPWGTAHAVWTAAPKISEPFGVVNADDYYGRNSLGLIYDHLRKIDAHGLAACMVGFDLKNTLSEYGAVSRGICKTDNKGNLEEIVEKTQVYTYKEEVYYKERGAEIRLGVAEVVSMNLMGFTPQVFPLIGEAFRSFLGEKRTMDNPTAEFYLPSVLDLMVRKGVPVPVLKTDDQWFGLTYKEDKRVAEQRIRELIDADFYTNDLWAIT